MNDKSPEQIEAERQFKEAVERDTGSYFEREHSEIYPSQDEIDKILGNKPRHTDPEMPPHIEKLVGPSPSMVAAWERFAASVRENDDVVRTRQENVKREREIMQDVVLPIGLEVIYARDYKPCKILSVSCGYMRQPYYFVQFAEPDGSYLSPLPPMDVNRTTQLYARDFVNYGLTLKGYDAPKEGAAA